jgi:hypothetical protein
MDSGAQGFNGPMGSVAQEFRDSVVEASGIQRPRGYELHGLMTHDFCLSLLIYIYIYTHMYIYI